MRGGKMPDKALEETIRGIFSEEMSNIVINAPSNNLLLYSFLVIAIVLIVSLVVIVKIASNSASKAINTGVAPYIEQLKSFHTSLDKTHQNYSVLSTKLSTLTEEFIKMSTLKLGDDNMSKLLTRQLDTLSRRVQDSFLDNTAKLQEHDVESNKRLLDLHKSLLDIRLHLLTSSNNQVFGNMLVDKGLVTRDELNLILQELLERS
jgi:hypothetical protein